MDLTELMQTSVEDLAEKQHKHLKKHVLGRLNTIVSLIELEEYKEIKDMVESSPAGDGYGCDNHFIDFRFEQDKPLDIVEILSKLSNLKSKTQ